MKVPMLGRTWSTRWDESCSIAAAVALVVMIAVAACLFMPIAAKAYGSLSDGNLQVPERLVLCQPLNRLSRERLRGGLNSANRDRYLDGWAGAMRNGCF